MTSQMPPCCIVISARLPLPLCFLLAPPGWVQSSHPGSRSRRSSPSGPGRLSLSPEGCQSLQPGANITASQLGGGLSTTSLTSETPSCDSTTYKVAQLPVTESRVVGISLKKIHFRTPRGARLHVCSSRSHVEKNDTQGCRFDEKCFCFLMRSRSECPLLLSGTSWDPNNAAAKHERMGGASVDSRGIAVSHSLFFSEFVSSHNFAAVLSVPRGSHTGGGKKVRGAQEQTHGHVFAALSGVCSMNPKAISDFAFTGRKSSWITGVHRSQSELKEQDSTMGEQNFFHTFYNKYSRRNVNTQVFYFLTDLEMLSSF